MFRVVFTFIQDSESLVIHSEGTVLHTHWDTRDQLSGICNLVNILAAQNQLKTIEDLFIAKMFQLNFQAASFLVIVKGISSYMERTKNVIIREEMLDWTTRTRKIHVNFTPRKLHLKVQVYVNFRNKMTNLRNCFIRLRSEISFFVYSKLNQKFRNRTKKFTY